MAQIIPFHRGVNLVYEQYLYKKDRVYAGKQHWRCVTAGCPGRAKADFSDPPLVTSSKTHNHIPDEELLRSRKLKASLCVDARATPLTSLQRVRMFASNDLLCLHGKCKTISDEFVCLHVFNHLSVS